uniref:OXA family beta-lactamase n=1 Tax=Klebsiella pneumoniae TaxID=573 RepID=UPI00135F1877|nr:Chain A, Class D Carbapenemase OXA-48 [Klebsiella pneumoniae]6PQI_B Chain B, Class D Carbapenemase OXA-48 [Klebsiella pneumoniae]6PQI_C Chain C, Class D Carbapenemase OXA-48 [Klebsiella pneumoniae]6PQI_D Chain D, Class D Carbapenemase OXA-48 [Klebsiella pneumoniae]6PSG_A Chain A, Class D Carbapenemase OXA-48 [Klebsiella pneumoniae]6PSG_B Chain B, Class D Carbapenemase OXA-48 [Klebsiella pneumoniae]6PSG_C Chain C, Class D Carbapenemase OXA-48 [Klebsiella pneumoniae]6PSG_D Chain D, Class D 
MKHHHHHHMHHHHHHENLYFQGWQENKSWNAHFTEHKSQGVVVLWNENKQQGFTNNLKRANQAFLPASTFKIPNSLIALDLGVVKDEHQVFKWDGQTRDIATWNRDHNLITAMKYSVVPVYQEFARQIGEARMSKMLHAFDYGNEDISGNVDSFWLDGGIRISATEQISFLRKLYHNKLHVSERSQRIVKQAMLTEANGDYIIRAKTGYSTRIEPKIGWWVGWVELDDNVWFFAMNMDMPTSDGLGLRQAITKEVLKQEKIIP